MENQLRSILCSGGEKNKGTKRDFSLVEDLRGVLLCLEGEIKAEGGLCTTGWHWEHSGTPRCCAPWGESAQPTGSKVRAGHGNGVGMGYGVGIEWM